MFGVIGSVLFGMLSNDDFIVVKRNKQYKRVLQIIYIVLLVIMGLLTLSLNFKLMPLYWISTGLIGLFEFPVLPILIEYAC